jgi:hypothetical protein
VVVKNLAVELEMKKGISFDRDEYTVDPAEQVDIGHYHLARGRRCVKEKQAS